MCMRVHGLCGMRAPERTSLRQPRQMVERLATARAGAGACPSSLAIEPLRLAATAACVGPPDEGKNAG